MNDIPENIDDKLFKVKFCPDIKSHLVPNQKICQTCKEKFCTFVCPANVYSWDEKNSTLIVNFENCLECGACRIACEKKAIDWSYPSSTCGVTFKCG